MYYICILLKIEKFLRSFRPYSTFFLALLDSQTVECRILYAYRDHSGIVFDVGTKILNTFCNFRVRAERLKIY